MTTTQISLFIAILLQWLLSGLVLSSDCRNPDARLTGHVFVQSFYDLFSEAKRNNVMSMFLCLGYNCSLWGKRFVQLNFELHPYFLKAKDTQWGFVVCFRHNTQEDQRCCIIWLALSLADSNHSKHLQWTALPVPTPDGTG